MGAFGRTPPNSPLPGRPRGPQSLSCCWVRLSTFLQTIWTPRWLIPPPAETPADRGFWISSRMSHTSDVQEEQCSSERVRRAGWAPGSAPTPWPWTTALLFQQPRKVSVLSNVLGCEGTRPFTPHSAQKDLSSDTTPGPTLSASARCKARGSAH